MWNFRRTISLTRASEVRIAYVEMMRLYVDIKYLNS